MDWIIEILEQVEDLDDEEVVNEFIKFVKGLQ